MTLKLLVDGAGDNPPVAETKDPAPHDLLFWELKESPLLMKHRDNRVSQPRHTRMYADLSRVDSTRRAAALT